MAEGQKNSHPGKEAVTTPAEVVEELTAALPHLSPHPSQSDGERVCDLIRDVRYQNWKNGGALSMDTDEAEAQAFAALAAVRAEATLAGAAAEREACARVADPITDHAGISNKTRRAIAAAIRARRP